MPATKTVKYIVFTCLIAIAVGLLVGLLASGPSVAPKPIPAVEGAIVKETGAGTVAAGISNEAASVSESAPKAPEVFVREVPAAPTWDETLGDILGDPAMSLDDKVDKLFKEFPSMPEAGQVEVVGHLSNLLLNNEDYTRMAKLALDTKLPKAVTDEVFNDVVNRPNSTRFPVLLEIARNPQHPKAADAREQLSSVLENDYGTDWHQWEIKIKEWQKENPE